nr:hypothetical protein RVX_1251 [Nitratidesulfovibrio sp. HK-II]
MTWRACCAVWLHPLPHVLGSPWLTACCAGSAPPACPTCVPLRLVSEGAGRKHGDGGVPRQNARRLVRPHRARIVKTAAWGKDAPRRIGCTGNADVAAGGTARRRQDAPDMTSRQPSPVAASRFLSRFPPIFQEVPHG